MKPVIETRLRGANPLPRDALLEQLHGQNVYHRLLDDVRAKKDGRMTDTTRRRQPENEKQLKDDGRVTPLTPERSGRSRRPGPRLAWVSAAVVIAVGAVVGLVMLTADDAEVGGPPSDPVATATAFVEAYTTGEVEAAADFLAADAHFEYTRLADTGAFSGDFGDLGVEGLSLITRFDQAVGMTWLPGPCELGSTTSAGSNVVCPYDFHGFFSDERGLGPYSGSAYRITVLDGKITSFIDNPSPDDESGWVEDNWDAFNTWGRATHPEDWATLDSEAAIASLLASSPNQLIEMYQRLMREFVEANTTAPPTTAAPDVETMTDLEVIEAGVAAFYSGEGERAAESFELSDRTDDEIRAEAAYQAAIGGRLDLSCREGSTPGSFTCHTPYHNTMTDAIGFTDSGDTSRVVVEDGVITEFAFSEHTWMLFDMGYYLASEVRFSGYEDCLFGPFTESCATIQLENLDAWAAWHEVGLEPADKVMLAMRTWYGGDCAAAQFIAGPEDVGSWWDLGARNYVDCSTSSTSSQTIEYESALGAEATVESCEATSIDSESSAVSCEVHYSNAMNDAVGKPPAVITRVFIVDEFWVRGPNGQPWYAVDYPEDTELLASLARFAAETSGTTEWTETCGSARLPECAGAIVDHLNDWAAWYETNG